ncbi:MAG: OmpA family protein, partial [Proteobacteria bacterium]
MKLTALTAILEGVVGQRRGSTLADRTFENRIAAAVNVGHRWRDRGTQTPGFPIEPMRNQFTASIGVNYLLKDTATKLIGEIFGAVPAQSASRNPARNLTSAEILGGVKHDFTQHLAGHAGLGAEIIQGVSSPDWRAYAGLNFTFGPVWNAKAKAVAVPPSPEKPKLEKFEVGNILFESASAKLAVNYKEILSGLVANLKGQAFTNLTIEGHTDSMGGDEYNLDLSRKRAEAIRTYLTTEEQIPNEKITAIGYGEERPVA